MIAHSRRSVYRPQPRPTRRPLPWVGTESYVVVGQSQSYQPSAADVGHLIYCVVTATNSYGDARTPSNTLGVITAVGPSNTQVPMLTGIRVPGQTISTDDGLWTQNPTSFAYQWQRDNHGNLVFSNIGAATSNTYTLTLTDLGSNVRSEVTATNAGGSATADSAPMGLIQLQEATTAGMVLGALDLLLAAQRKDRRSFHARPDHSL